MRGLDELLAAGFPHELTSIDTVDVVDHFGIDPEEYIDAAKIARKYYESSTNIKMNNSAKVSV